MKGKSIRTFLWWYVIVLGIGVGNRMTPVICYYNFSQAHFSYEMQWIVIRQDCHKLWFIRNFQKVRCKISSTNLYIYNINYKLRLSNLLGKLFHQMAPHTPCCWNFQGNPWEPLTSWLNSPRRHLTRGNAVGSFFLVDRVGRRLLLLLGMITMCITMLVGHSDTLDMKDIHWRRKGYV